MESPPKKEPNRRQFLKLGLGSVIGMTVGGKILLQPVSAEEIPHVSPEILKQKRLNMSINLLLMGKYVPTVP
ncbi:hypothetical protein Q8W16_13400 [Photobacterium damselae subsp. piscicida]|nr:hypothetical protein [Photobacterium damselae subsp. piscicida]